MPNPIARGQVAPGFEEVRAEFERNFARRGEIGAAVAAYWHGQKVADLWGGIALKRLRTAKLPAEIKREAQASADPEAPGGGSECTGLSPPFQDLP